MAEGEYFDLGIYARTVTTRSPAAQVWFDRGLNWTYAFNHQEAAECFARAIDLDADCACLTRSGRDAEARIIGQQLAIAQAMADVPITASCFCRLSKEAGTVVDLRVAQSPAQRIAHDHDECRCDIEVADKPRANTDDLHP